MIAEFFGSEAALEEADAFEAHFDIAIDEELITDLMLMRFILSGDPGLSPNEPSRQRLIDRHGFFGELALAQVEDDPRSQEIRERLADDAKPLLFTILAFGALVLGAMVVGLVAFGVLAVLFGTGKAEGVGRHAI